ncbi:MAG: hypothetical protein KAT91_03895, partial [Candidatus Aenigmarchaeota archaeon]|nr:hypothetical protein [Candidatus Aenigmarchaeota archaeon]
KLLKCKSAFYKLNKKELDEVADLFPENMTKVGIFGVFKILVKMTSKKKHLLRKDVMHAMKSLKYSRAKHYGW